MNVNMYMTTSWRSVAVLAVVITLAAMSCRAEPPRLEYADQLPDEAYTPILSQCGAHAAYVALKRAGDEGLSLNNFTKQFRGNRQIEQEGFSIQELLDFIQARDVSCEAMRMAAPDFSAVNLEQNTLILLLRAAQGPPHYETLLKTHGDYILLTRFGKNPTWEYSADIWEQMVGPIIMVRHLGAPEVEIIDVEPDSSSSVVSTLPVDPVYDAQAGVIRLEYDLGEVEASKSYTHIFEFPNLFPEEFKIDQISKSCSTCTGVEVDRGLSYAHAAMIKVSMTIDTDKASSPQFDTTAVLTGDSEKRRRVVLTLRGRMPEDHRLAAAPIKIDVGTIGRGEVFRRRVQVARRDGSPVVIAGTVTSSEALTLEDIVTTADSKSVKFDLVVNADKLLAGPVREWVKVQTEHAASKQIEIPIEGIKRTAVLAKPEKLMVGHISEAKEWVIQLNGARPFEVLGVSHNLGDDFQLEYKENAAEIQLLYVGGRVGAVNGRVVVEVISDVGKERVTIPIYGWGVSTNNLDVLSQAATATGLTTDYLVSDEEPQPEPQITIETRSPEQSTVKSLSLAIHDASDNAKLLSVQIEPNESVTLDASNEPLACFLSWYVDSQAGWKWRFSLVRHIEPSDRVVVLDILPVEAECRLEYLDAPAIDGNVEPVAPPLTVHRICFIRKISDSTIASMTRHLMQKPKAANGQPFGGLPEGDIEVVAIGMNTKTGQTMATRQQVKLVNDEVTPISIPPLLTPVAQIEGFVEVSRAESAVVFLRPENAGPIRWSYLTDLGVPDAIASSPCDKAGKFTVLCSSAGRFILTKVVFAPGSQWYGPPIWQQSYAVEVKHGERFLLTELTEQK